MYQAFQNSETVLLGKATVNSHNKRYLILEHDFIGLFSVGF